MRVQPLELTQSFHWIQNTGHRWVSGLSPKFPMFIIATARTNFHWWNKALREISCSSEWQIRDSVSSYIHGQLWETFKMWLKRQWTLMLYLKFLMNFDVTCKVYVHSCANFEYEVMFCVYCSFYNMKYFMGIVRSKTFPKHSHRANQHITIIWHENCIHWIKNGYSKLTVMICLTFTSESMSSRNIGTKI